jgi:hypothetical protein
VACGGGRIESGERWATEGPLHQGGIWLRVTWCAWRRERARAMVWLSERGQRAFQRAVGGRQEARVEQHAAGLVLDRLGAGGRVELVSTCHFCLCTRIRWGPPRRVGSRQTGLPGSHDPLQMARLQLERSDRGTPTPAHEWGSFLFNTRRIRDSPSARGPTSCRRSRRRGATQETQGECYTPGQTNVTRQSECTRRPELVAQRQVGSCPPAWLSGNRAASARITVSS